MTKFTPEEAIAKIRKLGKILRSEVTREHSMTKQEMAAVREAIRIQNMHRDKFTKEQTHQHKKERKHHL